MCLLNTNLENIKMKKIKIIKTLASVALVTIASNSVWAAGTDPDTSINNRAVISYNVGGAAQPTINSSPGGNADPLACVDPLTTDGTVPGTDECATTFVVDKKIDLTVTGTTTPESVAPNQAINTSGTGPTTAITYTVTNTGNSDEYFRLTPSQVSGDAFDTSGCMVTVPTLTSQATPVQILEDATLAVTVQCNIPVAGGAVVQGALSEVELLATAIDGTSDTDAAYADSGATETAAGVDIVLADGIGGTADEGFDTTNDGSATAGERNASHSDISSYIISTAAIGVTKIATVVWDPINEGTNPKRIPGSIIKYDITVTNTGAANATGIEINDALDSNVTYLATAADADALGAGAAAASGFAACTNSAGTALTCAESGGTVSSDPFDLVATSGTTTMTFFVNINN